MGLSECCVEGEKLSVVDLECAVEPLLRKAPWGTKAENNQVAGRGVRMVSVEDFPGEAFPS